MAARVDSRTGGYGGGTITFNQAQREAQKAGNSTAPEPTSSAGIPDSEMSSPYNGQSDPYGDVAAGVVDNSGKFIGKSELDPFGKAHAGAVVQGQDVIVPTAPPARAAKVPTPPPETPRVLRTTARPGSAAFRPFRARGARFAAPFRRGLGGADAEAGERAGAFVPSFVPTGPVATLDTGLGKKGASDDEIANAVLAVLQRQG